MTASVKSGDLLLTKERGRVEEPKRNAAYCLPFQPYSLSQILQGQCQVGRRAPMGIGCRYGEREVFIVARTEWYISWVEERLIRADAIIVA